MKFAIGNKVLVNVPNLHDNVSATVVGVGQQNFAKRHGQRDYTVSVLRDGLKTPDSIHWKFLKRLKATSRRGKKPL